ncbi:MAG: TetR/AcrR family transcriptional regulator [Sporichthyaceae bacterium]
MTTGNRGRRLAERRSPEEFFNAAVKILGEAGSDGLTVNRLCTRLGVTKGSFYHHFVDFDAFVRQLMGAWLGMLESYLGEMVALGDLAAQFDKLLIAYENTPHEAEGAIRAWARGNETVAAAVRHRDALVERYATAWMGQFEPDPDRCRVLAHMGVSMLSGMQIRPGPADRELLVAACVEFLNLTTRLRIRKELTSTGPRFAVVTVT